MRGNSSRNLVLAIAAVLVAAVIASRLMDTTPREEADGASVDRRAVDTVADALELGPAPALPGPSRSPDEVGPRPTDEGVEEESGPEELESDEDLPERVAVLDKVRAHTQGMPQRSAIEQARAANVLLTASVTAILDARGDFTIVLPDSGGDRFDVPAGVHCLLNGDRRYTFSVDEFPEFSEVVEILKGRGETVVGIDPQEVGTSLAPTLKDQIDLRFQEARGLAWTLR